MSDAALRALQLVDEYQHRKTQVESMHAFPGAVVDVRTEEEIAADYAAAIREIVAGR